MGDFDLYTGGPPTPDALQFVMVWFALSDMLPLEPFACLLTLQSQTCIIATLGVPPVASNCPSFEAGVSAHTSSLQSQTCII